MPSGREPNLFEVLRQDTRYGLRGVKNNPGFFAIAAFTLALGIGASAAVFSLVNTILLKRLPYPNSNRVLMIWRGGPIAVSSGDDFPWSPPEFGILAVILVSIGMYGVMSYSVIQRTTEIGVRMAVGAQRAQILLMIALQAARLAAVGIMIGLVAALITTRLMGSISLPCRL
jgi:hypothetical protein